MKKRTGRKLGRPLAGAERRRQRMVSLEPKVEAKLRALAAGNLSNGIAVAVARLDERATPAALLLQIEQLPSHELARFAVLIRAMLASTPDST